MLSGLYSDTGFADTPSVVDNWNLGPTDPLQSKATELVAFCYPKPSMLTPGSNAAHGYEALKGLLTPENLKHFLQLYKHWQNHWPMMHPSFNPTTAYDGLILTMVCIGAIYSDKMGVRQVRWLMELVRASVFRSSQVYKTVTQKVQHHLDDSVSLSASMEEIQALIHIHSLFVWHGSMKQRQQGQEEAWMLASIARKFELLHPLPVGHIHCSALHQPGPVSGEEVNTWTWDSWREQERRIRIMYMVLLIDASLAMFFNIQPQFDIYDIQLPLPADDAAWEATTEEDCAKALGLRGRDAQEMNHAGSRRPKQLTMTEALALLHQGNNFPHRATNAFSKFILIHAIHIQIYKLQRQLLSFSISGLASSGSSTPQSHNDWTSPDGTLSNNSSGYVTPTEGFSAQHSQAQLMLRSTTFALMLWKKHWDADMHVQYGANQRPLGFCRDGVHFYFLAKAFLQSSRRDEWAAQPETRFQQVFTFLKHIKAHVASDSASKNLDIGSVTSVSDQYGVEDLTVDMKLLFTPISDPLPL